MTAKLTPYPIMWEQFTTGFLTSVSIKKLPLLHPRDGGGGGGKPGLNGNLQLNILSHFCSYLKL